MLVKNEIVIKICYIMPMEDKSQNSQAANFDIETAKQYLEGKIISIKTAFIYFVIFVAVLFVFLLLLTTFLGYKFSIL